MAKLVFIIFAVYFLFQLWLFRKENWKVKGVIVLLLGVFGFASVFGGEILVYALGLGVMSYLGYAVYYYWVEFDWKKRLIMVSIIAFLILLPFLLLNFR